jgi:threonine/homoserine/homoserine lactone efflux protein
MFGTQHFLTFLTAAIALNITPGQDTLYIIGRSLSQGRRAGILSVFGIGSGCLVHITFAAIGLYSVLALCPPRFHCDHHCGSDLPHLPRHHDMAEAEISRPVHKTRR